LAAAKAGRRKLAILKLREDYKRRAMFGESGELF
jgi:hypothetical protein